MPTKETPAAEQPISTKNLWQRMRAVMQDVKRLQKDKQVGSGNYAYKAMSEEKVATTLRTALIEHGLALFPIAQQHNMVDYVRSGKNGETTVSLSTVDVQYKLINIDNPSEFEILASSGTGVDPQDKGVGKAMTYAMKYVLMRTFLIPTGDDPDDVHNEELERQQAAAAQAWRDVIADGLASLQAAPNLETITSIWKTNPRRQADAGFLAAARAARQRVESNQTPLAV